MNWMKTTLLLSLLTAGSLSAAEVTIAFPPAGSTLAGGTQTFVIGRVTPPDAPIEINGITVTPYRTGSFLTMVPVTAGKNMLRIRSGGETSEHPFYLAPAAAPRTAPKIEPLFPAQPCGVQTGQSFKVQCRAPSGNEIRALIGERLLVLQPQPGDPTLYAADLKFLCALENLPVTFFSANLPDAPAGTLSAVAEPAAFAVTGKLFEVRARTQPGAGPTVAILPPGFILLSTGYIGSYRTVWLAGRPCYVDQSDLSPIAMPPALTREQASPEWRAGFAPSPPKNRTPQEILIVLDAGHGGSSTGAIGPSGVMEKEIALIQVRQIEKTLRQAGYRVLLTREADTEVDLYERVRLAYHSKADAFISIHYNSCPPQYNPQERRHISTYAWNEIGTALGAAVHTELEAVSPVRSMGVLQESLAVCRNPAVPSILLELDFITTPEGEELIQSAPFQEQVAAAILKGIRSWCGEQVVKSKR